MSLVIIGIALLVSIAWLWLALVGTERSDQEWRVRQAEVDAHEARLELEEAQRRLRAERAKLERMRSML
jgi:type VI protein secretion system component VasK